MTTKTAPRRHVYGPIPSRLFGRALGVDPLCRWACNFDCVYCHLVRPEEPPRESLFATAYQVVDEVQQALQEERVPSDWITISGRGEPTLHPQLAEITNGIVARTSIPVAVFTNGSTLALETVRRALAPVKAVVLTVDAGDDTVYRFVNRPRGSSSFDEHVEGLLAFRAQFDNRLYAEVMLVPGVNDSIESLMKIRALISKLRPTETVISVASRPPDRDWVGLPDRMTIERARLILDVPYRRNYAVPAAPSDEASLANRVHEIVARHPMTSTELEWWYADRAKGVERALEELTTRGVAKGAERGGEVFWMARERPEPRKPKKRPNRRRANVSRYS